MNMRSENQNFSDRIPESMVKGFHVIGYLGHSIKIFLILSVLPCFSLCVLVSSALTVDLSVNSHQHSLAWKNTDEPKSSWKESLKTVKSYGKEGRRYIISNHNRQENHQSLQQFTRLLHNRSAMCNRRHQAEGPEVNV